ncbi:hypothetical protein Cs7R123_34110 [Catellatospora sp. TT07R-123]|uniref:hypothetical protein n=1 Tax=Catellatospora sp. TT07R-123 TaxID=2733863 RepID=UPI001B1859FE|nr:hypothetical protein [Catellatospora sp. TT07R-123]GHJ46069.1 hypothetical protein Cs7R123_34110 [Catellatospora sp. TT07R-123]
MTVAATTPAAAARGGRADVVYVLLLVQAGAGLLGMLGELLFMGGLPFYAIAPLSRVVVTFVFAALVVRGRRGALTGVIVLQLLSLAGLVASLVLGAFPGIDFTPTLTGLLTGLVLPVLVTVLCVRLLIAPEPGAGAR